MIYLRYLRENTAKLRENKRKLASKTDFRRLFISPAQESSPGKSKRARTSRILHPQYGFSIRSSFEHRGIIINHQFYYLIYFNVNTFRGGYRISEGGGGLRVTVKY